jgi:ADP-heptose:LPS heptosyltransferase
MPKLNHILVIRLSSLGDVAMTVPVLRLVAQTHPDVKLTVVSRRIYEPLFTDIPNVHFLEADVYGKHKGLLGLLKLAKEARLLGIDAVADLHNAIRSKNITRILRLSGIRSVTIDKGRALKRKLVNAKGMGLVKLKSTHQRYADVFVRLGLSIDLSIAIFPDRKPLNPRLHTLIGAAPKKCIGVAPFAAYKGKMYPMEMMKEVLAYLDKTQLYRVLLFGGKEEVEQLKELETQFSSVTNVAGTLTFTEELDLISNLDLMVSMDSANGHLAAMFGIPVITLWGVTHPYAGFTPYQQPDANQLMADRDQYPLIPTSVYGNKFPSDYENVMQTITTNTVLDKILELL